MLKKSSSSVKVFYPRHNSAEIVSQLKAKVEAIEAIVPIKMFALFGSYAKGNYTVSSDIDVLLVYSGPPQEDAYSKIRHVLNIPGLELHLYSEKEHQGLEPTVDQMLRNSISIIPQTN